MGLLGEQSPGSIVKIQENGVLVDFYVGVHNYENLLNGDGRTLLVRKNCYDPAVWNTADTNIYENSTVDNWLNENYKSMLTADARNAMKETTFYYTPGGGDNVTKTLSRSVFLMSVTELGGSELTANVEGTSLPIASDLQNAVYLSGSKATQWTRTPSKLFTNKEVFYITWFPSVQFNSQYPSNKEGIRPCFTIPGTAFVLETGEVVFNQPPTAPTNLQAQTPIFRNNPVTVSWEASTDPDGETPNYVLERKTDTEFIEIYRGANTEFVDTVPAGASKITYCVYAYNSADLQSDYLESQEYTVITDIRGILLGGSISKTKPVNTEPPHPENFEFLEYSLESKTWTAPSNGWYRFHVIGKCGDGADGIEVYADNASGPHGSGGAGGGSGGWSIHDLYLKSGDSIEFNITNLVTSLGNYCSATAGTNASGTIPGVGGIATGGNVANLNGGKGGKGGERNLPAQQGELNGAPAGNNLVVGSIYDYAGGGGTGAGFGKDSNNSKYVGDANQAAYAGGNGGMYAPLTGLRQATSAGSYPEQFLENVINMFGAGSGGGGFNDVVNSSTYTAGKKSLGNVGCIIVERGV